MGEALITRRGGGEHKLFLAGQFTLVANGTAANPNPVLTILNANLSELPKAFTVVYYGEIYLTIDASGAGTKGPGVIVVSYSEESGCEIIRRSSTHGERQSKAYNPNITCEISGTSLLIRASSTVNFLSATKAISALLTW